jgi:hypothetical protein
MRQALKTSACPWRLVRTYLPIVDEARSPWPPHFVAAIR